MNKRIIFLQFIKNEDKKALYLSRFVDLIYHSKKLERNCTQSGLSKRLLLLFCIVWIPLTALNCSVLSCSTCVANTTNNCTACNAGYIGVLGTCCANTLTNCLACSVNSNACDSCKQTYFTLNNGTCTECYNFIPYCSTCSSTSVCLSCSLKNYTVNSTSKLCQPCTSFMMNCSECSSPTVCTLCVNNSMAVNTTTGLCQNCSLLLTDCTNCTS